MAPLGLVRRIWRLQAIFWGPCCPDHPMASYAVWGPIMRAAFRSN